MVEFNAVGKDYPADKLIHQLFEEQVKANPEAIAVYFDKATQRDVVERLCRHLRPGGFLFFGHSETLTGQGLPLDPVAPTVFRRR